jgi:lycopene beta-cyclase
MTDHPFPRKAGARVMNIGTRGGRVKASTGFAFGRIQRDCADIVHSLVAHGHPFDVPTPSARYRTFDAMLLQILYRHGHLGKRIFTDIFKKNPIDRIFRFLDEDGDVWENLHVMASVPPWPFISAWLRLKLLRKI